MDTEWTKHFTLPPPGNMMENHDKRHAVFIKQGTLMFEAIENCIQKHMPQGNISDLKILDFGCGVGRVALPFFHKYKRPSDCVDVDAKCIDYLKTAIPQANPQVIGYEPPAPFLPESFDVIYAISVWTHLPPDKAERWMKEIIRILRPGGLALVTTASYAGLEIRRTKIDPKWGWSNVSDDDLRSVGEIFKPTPSPAGVTGTYGHAVHDPEWLRRNWSERYMPVTEIVSGGILSGQDINVMRKVKRNP